MIFSGHGRLLLSLYVYEHSHGLQRKTQKGNTRAFAHAHLETCMWDQMHISECTLPSAFIMVHSDEDEVSNED